MKETTIELKIPEVINPSDFEVGVIVARFQVPELHSAHVKLIDTVTGYHKKVILFLGVAPTNTLTKTNPLDFASRKAMIQDKYPNISIIPLRDQRTNELWSYILDNKIGEIYRSSKALLYGGRESFIPHYCGKNKTIELVGKPADMSGTQIRDAVAKDIGTTVEFRKGVIHASYVGYPAVYPCVDVISYNEENNTILLGRKENEKEFRFIGGHVDLGDSSLEMAAKREYSEETRGAEIGDLKYVGSAKIADWRHDNVNSGIISTLFVGKHLFGKAEASDDIVACEWFDMEDLLINYETKIVKEHIELFEKFIEHYNVNMNKIEKV
jgi:bifunctional NMN adenylyltransferase/nudix hydrolase